MTNDADIPIHEPPTVPDALSIIGKLNFNGVEFQLCRGGRVMILFDSTTNQVEFDNGAGPRENTRDLRSRIKITPRPASGTRALDRSTAPTIYDLEGEKIT